MRILHISNDYYHSSVYQTLHDGHLRHGLDSVFFVSMPFKEPEHGREHAIEARCFHPLNRYWYMNKQRKVYRHFREAVQQVKPELNHAYFMFSGGIHCLWAKREFGVPYVISVQDTDVNAIFKNLIPELVYAERADGDKNYDCREDAFHAKCVSYMLCRKYGIDTKDFDFQQAPEYFKDKEPKEMKKELSRIKDSMGNISSRMAKILEGNKEKQYSSSERGIR